MATKGNEQRATPPAASGSLDRPAKSFVGGLASLLATGFGSGLSPFAPGTAGTLVAVLPAWGLVQLYPDHAALQLIVIALVAVVAIWSAGVHADRIRQKDPGQVVVDEIAGYFVTVALLAPGWVTLAAGFVLFRLFDVTKPPPCRRAEGLAGGLGIVADDLVAGLYANLAIRLLCVSGLLSL